MKRDESEPREREEQLKTLHEISLILSQSDSPDSLCRLAVVLGIERFGFDRLSLWLTSNDPEMLEGTYGTDEQGGIRAEHRQRMSSTSQSRQTLFADRVVHVERTWQLSNDQGNTVGQGWHMMAAIRDDVQIIGVLNADNLLQRQPLNDYQIEVLGLYGAVIGHLYARLQKLKALQESEERFRAAVTGSNDGLYDVDLASGHVYYSPRFQELLGYANHADELPSHLSEFEQRLHPDDRANALQRMQESITQATRFRAEYRLRCRNGDYRWFQSRADVQCDPLGAPIRLAGFLTDITAAKRQQLLTEQTNQAAHVGGWELDVSANTLFWTEETYRIHEVDPANSLPAEQALYGFYTGESALPLHEAVRRALETGDGFDLDLDMTTGQGRAIAVRVIGNAQNDSGKITRLFGAIQDVTRSKQAEIALRESETRFRAIFAKSGVGIALVDMSGYPVMSNAALQEMLGYNEEELRIRPFTAFTHPDDVALDWGLYQELVEGKQERYQIEKRYLRKDGSIIWGRLTVSLVRDAQSQTQFCIGMAENITERKLAEQNLRDSLATLHTLASHLQSVREEERTRVAREVHDEFGQALTGLKIELAWLKRHMTSDKGPTPTETLLEKMDSMNGLIEATIKSVRRIATELRPAILDTFGLIPALEWQTIDFQNRTGIPCVFCCELETVSLDPERTTAVFRIAQESLTNVLRHAQASFVEVSLERQNDTLILTVEDNGIGIEYPNVKATRSFGLLGMQERALLLGGELQIISIPDQGTTVRLQIPAAAPS